MIDATKYFYLIFGLLAIVGGLMGFLKAKSRASLIAGSITGVVLIISAIFIFRGQNNWGLLLGLLVSAALAGQFVPKVMLGRAPSHTIIMAILSAASLILTIVSLATK